MLAIGGSAADAMIATMLCESVVKPQDHGLGGGFVATIYTKETGIIETLISRETAPAAATRDMFVNETTDTGAIFAAVPSFIYGCWRLHDKYGKLPWHTLLEPTIELCRNGIVVSKSLAGNLVRFEEIIMKEISLSEIFINPATQAIYQEGEIMFRRVLADTLEIIAKEGPEVIYRSGRIGRMLVEDIKEMGGIITEKDLQDYDVRWEEPLHSVLANGYNLYTSPLPTSGALLIFMLNVMKPLYTSDHELYWHRLIETFKHAYGLRSELADIHFEPSIQKAYKNLLDPEFAAEVRKLILDNATFTDLNYYGAKFSNVEDRGTAQISVLTPNGDAISVTSTINNYFGAQVRSRRTGIILNDQMNDFSTPGKNSVDNIPPSPSNFIKPGKRPMSSFCPSIVLDNNGNVKLIVGAAGGPRITTSVAQTILRYFVLQESIESAVNKGRLHHQLSPMHIVVEPNVPRHTTEYLQKIGHKLKWVSSANTSVTAIANMDGIPQPVFDQRRGGSTVITNIVLKRS
ncbi:scoloptoxin SSD14-like [Drosophila innubila]|uniref:scoloptoxin SSD14-like n=1 Tax=Drosophila innubila TaxID=198719 RepID=UPI00148BF6E9|nr:scoloptoxin SSD14-like [Drosophila innubila]